ncbi:MAG: hypothetical protein R3281_00075 [Balneolaceae bacterium]|nr:hypothetical protein [Balneolaceae bacterium]
MSAEQMRRYTCIFCPREIPMNDRGGKRQQGGGTVYVALLNQTLQREWKNLVVKFGSEKELISGKI